MATGEVDDNSVLLKYLSRFQTNLIRYKWRHHNEATMASLRRS